MATAESPPFNLTILGEPILSNPFSVGINETGAEIGCYTDQAVGVLHWVADTAVNQPTPAQIVAGEIANGVQAAASNSASASNTGQLGPFRVSPFVTGVSVGYWFVINTSTGYSNVVGSRFTTAVPTDPPVDPTEPETGAPDTLVSFYTKYGNTAPPLSTELPNPSEETDIIPDDETISEAMAILEGNRNGNGPFI